MQRKKTANTNILLFIFENLKAGCWFVYLEAGKVAVLERRRFHSQKNFVQRRQSVLRTVRFSVNLIRHI